VENLAAGVAQKVDPNINAYCRKKEKNREREKKISKRLYTQGQTTIDEDAGGRGPM